MAVRAIYRAASVLHRPDQHPAGGAECLPAEEPPRALAPLRVATDGVRPERSRVADYGATATELLAFAVRLAA